MLIIGVNPQVAAQSQGNRACYSKSDASTIGKLVQLYKLVKNMFALISGNADACIFYDKTNQTIDSLGLEADGALVCKLCGIL